MKMVSASKPDGSFSRCPGEQGLQDSGNSQNNLLSIERMLTMLTAPTPSSYETTLSPAPTPKENSEEMSDGYQVANAVYDKMATLTEETSQLKTELRNREATIAKKNDELKGKDDEIEALKRQILRMEAEKISFSAGAGTVEMELETLRRELEDEKVKKRNAVDLLKNMYKSVISLRLRFSHFWEQEDAHSLLPGEEDLEIRMNSLVARIQEYSEDVNFGSWNFEIEKEVQVMKQQLNELSKPRAVTKPSNATHVCIGPTPDSALSEKFEKESNAFEPTTSITPQQLTHSSPETLISHEVEHSEPVVIGMMIDDSKTLLSTPSKELIPLASQQQVRASPPKQTLHKIDDCRAEQGFFCTCGLQYRSKDSLQHHVRDCGKCFSSLKGHRQHRKLYHSTRKGKAASKQVPISLPGPSTSTSGNTTPVTSNVDDKLIKMPGASNERKKQLVHRKDFSKSHLGAYCTCGRLFTSSKALNHHVWYLKNQFRLTCTICNESFPSFSYLNKHMYDTHNMVPVPQGPSVSQRNVGQSSLARSTYRSRRPKPFGGRSTTGNNQTVEHGMDINKTDGGFHCMCGLSFDVSTNLTTHINDFTGGTKFTCQVCGGRFASMNNFNKHMMRKHKLIPEASLKGHIDHGQLMNKAHAPGNSKHRNDATHFPPTSSLTGAQQNRTMNEEHGLVEIFNLEPASSPTTMSVGPSCHPQESRYHCKCGQEFPQADSLMSHIHELCKGKPFKCKWCLRRFAKHCNLKSHIATMHKNVVYKTNFGCRHCGCTFYTQPQLIFHYEQVHRRD